MTMKDRSGPSGSDLTMGLPCQQRTKVTQVLSNARTTASSIILSRPPPRELMTILKADFQSVPAVAVYDGQGRSHSGRSDRLLRMTQNSLQEPFGVTRPRAAPGNTYR